MKKIYIILALLVMVLLLGAWSIKDNTKVFLVLYPQQLVSNAASSSAISMKGYERAHIIIDATSTGEATFTAKIFSCETINGTYTVADTITQDSTFVSGVWEFEVVKDLEKPYIKLEITPHGTMTISAVGVYYGKANAPF